MVLGVLALIGPISLLGFLNLFPTLVSNGAGWVVGYVAVFGFPVYLPLGIGLLVLGSWLKEKGST